MIDILIRLSIFVLIILTYRFIKHLITGEVIISGADIGLDKSIPQRFVYLINFPHKIGAYRAAKLLRPIFPTIDIESLTNGQFSVECKKTVKPKLISFYFMKFTTKLIAFLNGGSLIFIWLELPKVPSQSAN